MALSLKMMRLIIEIVPTTATTYNFRATSLLAILFPVFGIPTIIVRIAFPEPSCLQPALLSTHLWWCKGSTSVMQWLVDIYIFLLLLTPLKGFQFFAFIQNLEFKVIPSTMIEYIVMDGQYAFVHVLVLIRNLSMVAPPLTEVLTNTRSNIACLPSFLAFNSVDKCFHHIFIYIVLCLSRLR